jgi:hypothetical protein
MKCKAIARKKASHLGRSLHIFASRATSLTTGEAVSLLARF